MPHARVFVPEILYIADKLVAAPARHHDGLQDGGAPALVAIGADTQQMGARSERGGREFKIVQTDFLAGGDGDRRAMPHARVFVPEIFYAGDVLRAIATGHVEVLEHCGAKRGGGVGGVVGTHPQEVVACRKAASGHVEVEVTLAVDGGRSFHGLAQAGVLVYPVLHLCLRRYAAK